MRRLRIALCLPLLAVPLQAAGTATARAATVDPGAVECTAMGTLTTNAGLVPGTVTFTAVLTLSCPGVLDDSGTWNVSISGQMSPGFCAGGEGLGFASGTGPSAEGSLSGSVQVAQSGSHIQMAGGWSDNDPAGEEVQIGVEATPTSGIPCVTPQTTENLTGHATIADLAPPPDSVACALSGSEAYNPAVPLVSGTYDVAGNVGLTCVNPASDDAGAWTLAYAGGANGDCGEATGSVAITSGTSPEGSVGGNLEYVRVGTLFLLEGTISTGPTDSHSFAEWGAMLPNADGACSVNPWTSSTLVASGGMAESG